MFTGIIECMGIVVDSRTAAGGRRLRVDGGPLVSECAPGASVCISGVCLTVACCAPPLFEFDVIRETLAKTTLGRRRPGDPVNLERSLRVGDRLDGHFVQGHVETTAEVVNIRDNATEHVISLRPTREVRAFMVPKGSIALDGVSLTIAGIDADAFSIALIPTTLERTTLGRLRRGDFVNVETDMVVRTIVHWLSRVDSGLREGVTYETLRAAGFA